MIDDIDMQWCHGQQNLQTFLEIANNFHPTIKFTNDISNEQHIFLDTASRIESGKLIVDLYSKPTDKHQYFLPSSFHPKHRIEHIPYSLALRIRRICSRECDFQVYANELSKKLQSRGYSIISITSAISKANAAQRKELFKFKTKPSQIDRIPFFVTYHPDMPKTHKILEQHWPKIESSSKLKRIFPEKPLVACRRPISLKDILVRAKLNSQANPNTVGYSGPCNTSRCQTCKIMRPLQTFKSMLGATSSIKGTFSCKTMNAVYLISCEACKKQYVGETRQAFNKQVNLHRSDWKTRKFDRSSVAEHFSAARHSFEDVELCVIEAKETWSDSQGKEREPYWIRRLCTVQPSGIN